MPHISKLSLSKKKAIVAGHLCLDILPDLQTVPYGRFFDLFHPGHLLETGKMNIATGGAASNTGISLSKLGINTTIIAKIGSDSFGEIVRGHLNKYVRLDNLELHISPQDSTSYTIIITPPGIDRIFLHHPGANDSFSADEIDFTKFQEQVIFHYGYPQLMRQMYLNGGEQLVSLFAKAKENGFTTSLDTTFPDPSSEMGQVDWNDILQKTLPYVDIFCPSYEEAFFMLEKKRYLASVEDKGLRVSAQDVEGLTSRMINYGAKIAFLKLGEQGGVVKVSPYLQHRSFGRAWYAGLEDWAGKLLWTPSFNTDVVGTTGAGDATIAGFLAAILNEQSIEESMLMAMAAGGCNVEAIDSVSGVCSWEETANRVNRGWQQNEITGMNKSEWQQNTGNFIWIKKGSTL